MRWSSWSAGKLWIAGGYAVAAILFVVLGVVRDDAGFYWASLLWVAGVVAYGWQALSERHARVMRPELRVGTLASDAGRLACTIDGERIWSFELDSLQRILEYTTDGGPFGDDWFLVFVAGEPERNYQVPVGVLAEPLGWILEHFGQGPELRLYGSTEDAQRVVWPLEPAGATARDEIP